MLYFYTIVSRLGLGEPPVHLCLLGGRHTVRALRQQHGDSEEPKEPWVGQEGPEYWEEETRKAKNTQQTIRGYLQALSALQA